ncbi:MAG: PAS domain S-box protein [Ferruginibacter sp.]
MDATNNFDSPGPRIALHGDEEFRILVNCVKEYAIFMIDPGGVIKTWNEGAKYIKGYDANEIIGKHISVFYTKKDIEKGVIAQTLQMAQEQGSFEDEGWRVRKDGTVFWADVIFTAIYDKQHQLTGYAKVTRDISKQKNIKDDLSHLALKQAGLFKSAYEKLLFHIENTPLGFIEWDRKYHIRSLSKRAEDIFGWNLQEFIENERTGVTPVYEEDRPWVFKVARQLLKGIVERNNIQLRNYRKDGRVIWCDWFNSVLKDEHGKVITIMSLVQDISERKETEENLRHSEARYRQIVGTAQEGIWLIDEDNRTTFVNKQMCAICEYSQEEMLGKDIYYFLDDAWKEEISKSIERRKIGLAENIDVHFTAKSGRHIWVNISANPIFDEDGNYKGALAMVSDITEKKILQLKLVEEQLNKQKQITKAVVSAQEKERAEIGEELHDNVNQLLAASSVYLTHCLSATDYVPFILKSQEYIATAIEEIRKLSHALVGPNQDKTLGLIDSIEELIGNITILKDIEFTFNHSTYHEEAYDAGFKLVIYRIIQEQMSNILKHAEASRVELELIKNDHNLLLTISDNGKGFDPSAKRKGIGLKNIKHRAEIYDGIVHIVSTPGNGSKMEIIFKNLSQ